MEFLEISEEEVTVEDVPETRLNATDREYADEQFSVSKLIFKQFITGFEPC